jgi:hypothetical protein
MEDPQIIKNDLIFGGSQSFCGAPVSGNTYMQG